MRVSVLRAEELGRDHLAAWRGLVARDPALANPFLQPEFTQSVAAVRPDVAVAVVEEGGLPVALLPFQRRGRVGRFPGGGLADCQALVAAPGWQGEARALVRGAGLSLFEFTQLRAAQPAFAAHHRARFDSPVITLAGGFEAYAQERRRAGSSVVTQTLAHARRLERECGPLRFALHDPDPRTLHRLIGWKRAQYARARWGGALDLFERPWTAALLERTLAMQAASFAGVLSTLHAGDRLIAAHYGLRAGGVLHSWFPAYDEEAARHSPGRVLLLELVRAAAAAGLSAIELGGGEEGYKRRFANAAVPMAAGFVGTPGPALWLRQAERLAAPAARRLPLGGGRRGDEWLFRRGWERDHA